MANGGCVQSSKHIIGISKYSLKTDSLYQGGLLRQGLKQRLGDYPEYEVGQTVDRVKVNAALTDLPRVKQLPQVHVNRPMKWVDKDTKF